MSSWVSSSRSLKVFDGAGDGERHGALETSSSLQRSKPIRSNRVTASRKGRGSMGIITRGCDGKLEADWRGLYLHACFLPLSMELPAEVFLGRKKAIADEAW